MFQYIATHLQVHQLPGFHSIVWISCAMVPWWNTSDVSLSWRLGLFPSKEPFFPLDFCIYNNVLRFYGTFVDTTRLPKLRSIRLTFSVTGVSFITWTYFRVLFSGRKCEMVTKHSKNPEELTGLCFTTWKSLLSVWQLLQILSEHNSDRSQKSHLH